MPENHIRKYRDYNQTIEVSEIGGSIKRWNYHGVDIFSPRREVTRAGEKKIRGGMHACFPNFGNVDPKFGLSQHGPLRNRTADKVIGSVFLFHGNDLLGSAQHAECEVMTNIALEPSGMTYSLAARLSKPAKSPVYVNFGLHPYFRTPEMEAIVTMSRHRRITISDAKIEPRYEAADRDATVILPGVGSVHMRLGGSAWEQAKAPQIVLWRDAKNAMCVEPVLGKPGTYGQLGCLELTEKWLDMRCQFKVTLA